MYDIANGSGEQNNPVNGGFTNPNGELSEQQKLIRDNLLEEFLIIDRLPPKEKFNATQKGRDLLINNGIDPVGESILDMTMSVMGGLTSYIETALKEHGAARGVRLSMKSLPAAGAVIEYQILFTKEYDNNGENLYKARLSAGAGAATNFFAASSLTAVIIGIISTFPVSIGIGTLFVAGTFSSYIVSAAYEHFFKESIDDYVINTFPENTSEEVINPIETDTTNDASGGLLASIGGLFGGAAESVMSYLPYRPSRAVRLGLHNDNYYDKATGQLIGYGGNYFAQQEHWATMALGRSLIQDQGRLADIFRRSRVNDISSALEEAVLGKNGNGGLVGNFIGNAAASGVAKLLGSGRTKQFTHSYETARSQEASSRWRLSESQQLGDLAKALQKAKKNL